MKPPEVTVIQSWPAVLSMAEAASYLGESVSNFRKIWGIYSDRIVSFNLLPDGDTKFRRETLDAFIIWRESRGKERKTG